MIGLPDDDPKDDLNHVSLLQTILVLNVAILIGFGVHEALVDAGVKLPLFVACLLSAIALTNTVPRLFPKLPWPSRTRALALVSDLSLNVFLAMSLMSMQLWTLGGLGPASGRGAGDPDDRRRPLHAVRGLPGDGRLL